MNKLEGQLNSLKKDLKFQIQLNEQFEKQKTVWENVYKQKLKVAEKQNKTLNEMCTRHQKTVAILIAAGFITSEKLAEAKAIIREVDGS